MKKVATTDKDLIEKMKDICYTPYSIVYWQCHGEECKSCPARENYGVCYCDGSMLLDCMVQAYQLGVKETVSK